MDFADPAQVQTIRAMAREQAAHAAATRDAAGQAEHLGAILRAIDRQAAAGGTAGAGGAAGLAAEVTRAGEAVAALGAGTERTARRLTDAWDAARAGLRPLAGDLRALDALADSVHLVTAGDVRAAEALAAGLRQAATQAGATAAELRALESIERRIGAFSPTARPLVAAPPPAVPPPDPADIERKAVQAADLFVAGLRRELVLRQTDAREALFLGLTDRATYQRASAEAGGQFNAGVIRELQRLGDRGELLPAVHQKLVRELREDGLEAGRALVAGVERGTAGAAGAIRGVGAAAGEAGAGVRGLRTTTEEFGRTGQRAANAAVAVAFGLEAIARGGSGADGGLRTALRAAASFAAMFGTPGLIVSGVLATTAAVVDLFRQSRDEMAKTAASFYDSLNGLIRAANGAGLAKEQQRLFSGGVSFDQEGTLVREAGVQQLREQVREQLLAQSAAKARLDTERATLAAMKEQDLAANAGRVGAVSPERLTRERALVQSIAQQEIAFQRAKAEIIRLQPVLEARERQWREVARAAGEAIAAEADRNDIGRRLSAEERARREADRGETRAARETREELERQATAVGRIAERATDARLAFEGDRDAARETAGAFLRLVDTLRDVARLQRELPPAELAIKLATTRVELEREIRAAIPDDPFEIHVRVQVDEVARDFERAARRAAATGVNPYIDEAFRGVTPEEFAQPLVSKFADAAEFARQIADDLSALPESARAFVDTLADGVDAAAQIARGVGDIKIGKKNDNVLQTLGGVGSLLGGLTGLMGTVQSLGQALFGASAAAQEAERANREALRRNTQALSDLREGFNGDAPDSAARLQAVFSVADAFARRLPSASNAARGVDPTTPGGINNLLADFHLTREQLQATADALGIDLGKGLNRDVYAQLAAAARLAAEQLTHFGTSLDEQRLRADLRRSVFDEADDPGARLRDEQDFILKNAGAGITARFRDITIDTAEGRAAFEAAARTLLDDLDTAGRLGLDDFGRLTRDDLFAFLRNTDDAMDELGDSARDAASNLSDLNANITGFRVQEFRFRAQAPERPFGGGGGATPRLADVLDRPIVLDPVLRPPTLRPRADVATSGDIHIHVNLNGATVTTQARDGPQLLASVLAAAGVQGRAMTGPARDALTALARALGSSAAAVAQ